MNISSRSAKENKNMKQFKLFGCHDYLSGGKIIAIISLVENIVKSWVSVTFILWAAMEAGSPKMENGKEEDLRIKLES